ncbi:helix-turn-helix domain-containing protein [Vagococcus hydrophili]|uniref:Helix-turn-helix transcriptional regulator n=1 Tax=Vagococcus hydrophili TaxID=2714947 RepID=A0A6G8AST6_9ENTE|nr:helix-turn-helix transcriptional regulator [Vagococcus hydrophili]QIL48066.1 helix-turn-helix transcriptional regulator [Vagococcus hydrophili]
MIFGLEIAKRIRELRIQQNITQEALANKAGIDSSFLGRIERGQNPNLQVDTLDKIITSLNVDYITFFSFNSSENEKVKLMNKLSLVANEDELLIIFNNIESVI